MKRQKARSMEEYEENLAMIWKQAGEKVEQNEKMGKEKVAAIDRKNQEE